MPASRSDNAPSARRKPRRSGSDNRKPRTLEEIRDAYGDDLERRPLAPATRSAYLRYASRYLTFLSTYASDAGSPTADAHARDYAARDFKIHLKKIERLKPATVNLALAAVDDLNHFLGLGPADVRREELPQQAPRALHTRELQRLLRACERNPSVRNRAIVLLLLHTALRESECAALDLDDILLSARKGQVVVRDGKGNRYREVPLNAPARDTVRAWMRIRDELALPEERALFVNRYGRRLSVRSIDKIVRAIAAEAELELSPHVLRHTALTRLVRDKHDLVLVAEIAGHKRLETTRRYTRPSAADRAAAMDALDVEY